MRRSCAPASADLTRMSFQFTQRMRATGQHGATVSLRTVGHGAWRNWRSTDEVEGERALPDPSPPRLLWAQGIISGQEEIFKVGNGSPRRSQNPRRTRPAWKEAGAMIVRKILVQHTRHAISKRALGGIWPMKRTRFTRIKLRILAGEKFSIIARDERVTVA